MRRNRLFSFVFVMLLAMGIGTNTVIFSFIDTLILKPLPVLDPQNLVLLEKIRQKQVRPDTEFNYRQYRQMAAYPQFFSGLVAEQAQDPRDAIADTTGGTARLITTQIVSPNYFSELGVRPLAGRLLRETDANVTSNIPVVLSYQFWQARFGGAQSAIGQIIRLKDIPFLVVGVVPREFHSVDIDRAPDVRLPISAAPELWRFSVTNLRARGKFSFQILGRLRDGISAGRAEAAIGPELRDSDEWILRQANPLRKEPLPAAELEETVKWSRDFKIHLQPAGHGVSQLRDQFSKALVSLMGGVGLLLLAVCANLAGLLLAKAEYRRKEIAVRMAVGAGRMRLMRQLLTEGSLLTLLGGGIGTAFACALCPAMVRFLPVPRDSWQFATPQVLSIGLDWRVLGFTLLAATITCLFFTLPPAWRGTQVDLNAEMKGERQRRRDSIWGMFPIAVQVALALILLTGAMLMARTFWNLERLNPGFDRAHIAEFTVNPALAGYEGKQLGNLYSAFEERVAELPDVRSVAYADAGLMRGVGIKFTVAPQGIVLPKSTYLNASLNFVGPAYFQTMGIGLLSGRNLDSRDYNAKPARVIINRALADLLFPHETALGRGFVSGVDGTKPPTDIVVGVVANAKYRSMREQDPPTCYALLSKQAMDESSPLILYVRTLGDPASIIGRIRNVLRQIDASVPLTEVSTIDQDVENSLWQERLVAMLSGFFAVAVLLLASVGLYGTLAYWVAQRAREFGIRMAVGAQMRHIVQAVCSRVGWALALGLAAGIAAAYFALRALTHLVYGVKPLDPVSFVVAVAFILLCSTTAALVPSLRAARIDPAAALRKEA